MVSKTDFNNKIIRFDRKIVLYKTKYLKIRKILNSLTKKGLKFFLSKICFATNDGSQNTFVYQPTRDTLELKKTKLLIVYLAGSKRKCIVLNLIHCVLLSCVSIKYAGHRRGIKFDKDSSAVEENNYFKQNCKCLHCL